MGVYKYGIPIFVLFALAVAMTSCPPPIDEDLLIFVQDEIAPAISVFSPDNNSSYRSLLSVAGQVTDSSESEGDNKGRIASLTYQVLDHSQLSGDVSPAGDGIFEFSFATTGLSGTEILVIRAEDWNGNLSEKSLTLHENDEDPFVLIDSPENFTTYRSEVIVQATVQNSDTDTSTAEVSAVTWEVPGSTLTGTIDPVDWEDGTFTFTFFTTNPPLHGTRRVIVTAEDLNAHSSDALVELWDYEDGPYIELTLPEEGSTYPSVINIAGTVADSASEIGSVNEIHRDTPSDSHYGLTYKVGSNDPVVIPESIWEGDGSFNASFSRGTYSGTMVIRVTAKDKNDHETVVMRTLLDPETGPQLTVATTPTPATGYSQTIFVSGTVRDADGTFPPPLRGLPVRGFFSFGCIL